MAKRPVPGRVVLKVSGNALADEGGRGFGRAAPAFLASELKQARQACPQIAVVVGGGNIMRGAKFCASGAGRVRADHAGMLATVINALLLRDCLEALDVPTAHYSAFAVPGMVERFEPAACIAALQEGRLVLLSGGTGNPFFTTDTAAALRAFEIGAELVLKATRVDGVYSSDPEVDPGARLYERISYQEVLERKLGVMDLTAISFCMEHGLPVRVFNYSVEGNIRRAAAGEPVGTLVGGADDGG